MQTAMLIKSLIRIARRIGRWLIKQLAETALVKFIGYLEGHAKVLARRGTKFAKRRAARWKAAAKWLTEHAKQLTGKALKAVCPAADAGLRKLGVPERALEDCEAPAT